MSKRMLDNYVTQFNEAACSVATAATILNTARMLKASSAPPDPITQMDILNTVKVVNWKERIVPREHGQKRGLPITELGIAIENSLIQYGIFYDSYEVVPFDHTCSRGNGEKDTLYRRLVEFEKSDHHFLIAHFNQGIFLKGLHLPHISPVAAFNAVKQKVLVLDVDRDGPGPYWVSFDKFYEGLSSNYNGKLEPFGYTGGGYIWIRLGDKKQ